MFNLNTPDIYFRLLSNFYHLLHQRLRALCEGHDRLLTISYPSSLEDLIRSLIRLISDFGPIIHGAPVSAIA